MNTVTLIKRWWAERNNPSLKCERMGHIVQERQYRIINAHLGIMFAFSINNHYVRKCQRCNEMMDCPREIEKGSTFYEFDTDEKTYHELETQGWSILGHSEWYKLEEESVDNVVTE